MMNKESHTDFGFKTVPTQEKQSLVGNVFSSVANNYDVMNDAMSLGLHRLWKRFAVGVCDVRPGHTILDLAGGTGDLSKQFAKQVGNHGLVILSDINAAMLAEGRKRLIDAGLSKSVRFMQMNAESIHFADNSIDCIAIGFGLRNVTNKEKALAEMARVLKPGGKAVILEFSKPVLPLLQSAYDQYSFKVIPFLGHLITQDRESYQYLVESIRMHPDQEDLKQRILDAGFDTCDYYNLSGGIVAVHVGIKH